MKKEKLLSETERAEFRQIAVEANDERNVALGNAAKARAYELLICLYAASTVIMAIFKLISLTAFLVLLGVFVLCQCYFVFRLWKYHKEM